MIFKQERNMQIEIILHKLSGHAKEGTVGEVVKNPGDPVTAGETLILIETGKGVVEVPAEGTGTVESIRVKAGEKVKIGQILGTLSGEKAASAGAPKKEGFSYSIGPAKPVDRELECDITVIGGGPGGYVAAIQAAKMGAKVILVEKESLGGTCLNWGCIPTKALIRSAEVYQNIKNAEKFGLGAGHFPADIRKIVHRKDEVVKQLVQGVGYLLEQDGVTLLKGFGTLEDGNTVKVAERQYNTTIKTGKTILATGSSSCLLPIPGMDSLNVLTSTEALSLEELPRKMAIIGGGIIGMEFAFLFSNLGVEVTVFEYFDTILTVFDEDIIQTVTASASEHGINLITGAKVNQILENESGGCILQYELHKKEKYDLFEKVLVAVGRQPCYDGLDLEKNGIELTPDKKGIQVDETLKTSCDSVYAIGDITNKIQLAHVASHQGVVAARNIMGESCAMDYRVVPSAVFTFPEFATVGISEKDAEKQGLSVRTGTFPFAANGKALTLGESEGFVKLIEEEGTGVILGGAIVGPHATDLIGEITLAVKKRLKSEDIAETIHPHPTCGESIHEASLALGLGSIHFV